MSTKARSRDDGLRPIEPSALWDRYVRRKGNKRRQNTLDETERAWDAFCRWFDAQDDKQYIVDLGPYFPVDFHDYLRRTTEKNELSLYYFITRVKSVIDFGKDKGYLDPECPYGWDRPELSDSDRQRDEYLDPARGADISDYIRLAYTNEKEHVMWKLAFDYGLRKSAIRAIDIDHVIIEPEGENPPHIRLRDRPELGPSDDMGLPLKNTLDWLSDRLIPLKPDMAEVLDRYISRNRIEPGGTDEYGLEGLLTTKRSARISANCIYITLSNLTSPATYEGGCDCDFCREFRETHGKECDCDWCEGYDVKENREIPAQDRYKCDWSRGPHAIRHGAITKMRSEGVPLDTISHIVGTSPQTIVKTYDRRDEAERMNEIANSWLGREA